MIAKAERRKERNVERGTTGIDKQVQKMLGVDARNDV